MAIARRADRRRSATAATSPAGRGPRTRSSTSARRVLTPGLVDGHIHPVLGHRPDPGRRPLRRPHPRPAPALVRAAAERLGPDDWVLGYGLDPNAFGDAPVTAAPLTEVLGDRPGAGDAVRRALRDGHPGRAAPGPGSPGRAPFDGGAERRLRRRRGADRAPAGDPRLRAGARRRCPRRPRRSAAPGSLEILAGMAATGITAGNVMDFADDSADLVAAAERGRRAADPAALRPVLHARRRPAPSSTTSRPSSGRGGRRWQVEGVKFIIDGTIDGGTAWLEHADSHGESTAPVLAGPGRVLGGDPVPGRRRGADGHPRHRRRRHPVRAGRPGRPARRAAVPHRIEHIETHARPTWSRRFVEQGVVGQHAADALHPLHPRPTTATTGRSGWAGAGRPRLPRPRPARGRRRWWRWARTGRSPRSTPAG